MLRSKSINKILVILKSFHKTSKSTLTGFKLPVFDIAVDNFEFGRQAVSALLKILQAVVG